jgi:hypothetical protein
MDRVQKPSNTQNDMHISTQLPEGHGFESQCGNWFFHCTWSSSRTMAPGFAQPVTEMSTGRFLEVKHGCRVRLTTLSPSVRQLYGQCGILYISEPYRPPRSVTGIGLFICILFFVCNVSLIVCVALCAVFCLSVVLFCVLCLMVIPLPLGKKHSG